jgi:hypothetical protein
LSSKRGLLAIVIALTAWSALGARADAVPLFAQRYHFKCTVCHSVMPELNAFGNAFRDNGYRLPGLAKHGTTIVALREQFEYQRDPATGTRRFAAAGAILGAVEVGQVEAFLHETLGSYGSPASPFLMYLATRDANSGILYRAGLFELPLPHSPIQRNDTLVAYGYEGAGVGLNDLSLATTRWGLEAEKTLGAVRVAGTLAVGNGGGSAYGGPPVSTGRTEAFATPEFGLFTAVPIARWLRVGVDALSGARSITVVGRPTFTDGYQRGGAWVEANAGRFGLLAEQYYGRDGNGDGNGDTINSRGGYVRLRWALGSHAFLGVREDAAATPAATRSLLWYAEVMPTTHMRFLIEQQRPIPGGPTSLEGALTIGFPWPLGY